MVTHHNDIVLTLGVRNILADKWTIHLNTCRVVFVNYYIDITNDDVDTGLFSIRDIISGFEVETVRYPNANSVDFFNGL
ncbi:hypothetical protein O9992_16385 [Vibrio lentus]|nr:hypothetical protein [Vibrio lentus]